jgi:hypothetical protein
MVKYIRTKHLPSSPGATSDDKVLLDTRVFEGQYVIATEKLDGECFSLYPYGCHARSLDSGHHVSQSWIRGFHAKKRHLIPEGYRVVGEYVYAKHSIHYKKLTSYYYVFAVFNPTQCLSWEDTVAFCLDAGFTMVPTLWAGKWPGESEIHKYAWTGHSMYGGEQEGYVIRDVRSFPLDDYHNHIAKYVRAGHVKEDAKHWKSTIVLANLLNKDV